MKLFHNSRDIAYRKPYGAVPPGTEVTLAIDVADVPNARVQLRTWTDGEGERLYEMNATEALEDNCDEDALAEAADQPADSQAMRYQVTIAPETDGIVWYHFVITDAHGNTRRYGAKPGCVDGVGQTSDWEPPSFQLTIHAPRDLPPAWHEMIGGYLRDEQAAHTLEEIIETMCENYPVSSYRSAIPWDETAMEADPSWSPWPAFTPSYTCESSPSNGFPSFFIVNDEVFGFWNRDDAGNAICTLMNASLHKTHDVPVAMITDEVSELLNGYGVRIVSVEELRSENHDEAISFNKKDILDDASNANRFALAHLEPLGACALHFHAASRLQQPMEAGMGVLAHITSLPAKGTGTLGEPAKRFVDLLAEAGIRYWQVLPINPTDDFGSPYAGISAFAGNTRLLEYSQDFSTSFSASPHASASITELGEYKEFCERESYWLEPYAAFMAIRQKFGENLTWQEWPQKYRRYSASLISEDDELNGAAEAWRQAQYLFDQQWTELHDYANEKEVLIVGDMPIYVSANSVDVWAHPDIFQLDANGSPIAVAGCAPDAFAVDGQVWGNPLYNWDACKADGYTWWLRRLQRAFQLYDVVRLDHFIGFSRYFSIPAGEKASAGTYFPGPGIELFQRAYEKCGPLPIIAEDLGLITPAVRALSASCGFPGMDIAQFVDGNDPLSGYQPRPDKIAYTGTHDNQTLVGYCEQRYPHLDGRETAAAIMEMVATCSAPVCIVPLQDLMGLDDSARMNVPGTADGNWIWQANEDGIPGALEWAKQLVALHFAHS